MAEPRLITIHLPEGGTKAPTQSRADALKHASKLEVDGVLDPPVVAVYASAEGELRAFASGQKDLVAGIIADGYPFICLIDLLEARWVWVFAPCEDCARIRQSLRAAKQKVEADNAALVKANPSKTLDDLEHISTNFAVDVSCRCAH